MSEVQKHEAHGRVVDRDVDELASPRAVPRTEAREDREGRVEAAREVCYGDSRNHGSPGPIRRHSENPCMGLERDVVPRQVLCGPRCPVAAEGTVDEPRVCLCEG